MLRPNFNLEKSVEAIDYIAQLLPGVTQYYLGKILFFADREHLLDYGRPITGDRYVAMVHGPVPSIIRDLLKMDSSFPDEMLEQLRDRVNIKLNGNRQEVTSKGRDTYPNLSGSDLEHLAEAVNLYGKMGFATLREVSHHDSGWSAAWARDGEANEMDVSEWLHELDDPDAAKTQLIDFQQYQV